MDIEPIYFLTPSTKVLVKFKNDDQYEYFPGVVTKINHYGKDANGGYINCSIDYDDGETVSDSQLYNNDFDENTEDSWKFDSNISYLIKYMVKSNAEITQLREIVNTLNEVESEEEEEEEKEMPLTFIERTAKFIFDISLAGFITLWSYKLAKDLKFIA